MNRESIIKNQVIHMLDNHLKVEWIEAFSNDDDSFFSLYLQNGVILVCYYESITIGFGIFSKMRPSLETLDAINKINRTIQIGGSLQFAKGQDDNNWSLVYSFKIPFFWLSDSSLDGHKTILQALLDIHGLKDQFISNWVEVIPKEEKRGAYISDTRESSGASLLSEAFVLMSHIS